MTRPIELTVNGQAVRCEADDDELLADVLRDRLALFGTRLGCHEGVCGACTVLLDGDPVRSCLVLIAQVEGHDVTTVEGLADGPQLSPLQTAFIDHGALQCGFCTAGMLVAATAYLRENPNPTAESVRQALAGNLCRCTGYVKIIEAVMAAVGRDAEASRASPGT